MKLGSCVIRATFLFFLAVWAFPARSGALPARLVLALDGIAYRDMKALQEGVVCTNFWGRRIRLRAFTSEEGYFPVSRMVSTFPSISDVAWTDIFGDRPLNGYQRTYFSAAAGVQIVENGLSTSMEHERQMHWEEENSFIRGMGYLCPMHTFEYEMHEMMNHFLQTGSGNSNYYAYIRSSDDAQHMDRNILSALCRLDKQLRNLRARCRAQEGHDLQIAILSDHGHNHAGRAERVGVRDFLKESGYRISESIVNPKDVVLPTVGIESWVEIHNSPADTEALMQRLTHLKGVDVLAAAAPGQTNRFLVMNAKGDRAIVECDPARNSFRYCSQEGDPLQYRPVIESLERKRLLDAGGFASADAWMEETLAHHYPLALERIVCGLTRITLNPATILISLDNHYVNAGWLVEKGSRLVTCGSTHGGLDDINSDGILLSTFVRTQDTSSSRVARLFDNFAGLRQYRVEQSGAEWVSKKEQALTRIARTPFDRDYQELSNEDVFLRIWSPRFSPSDNADPVEVTIKKYPYFSSAQALRGNHTPMEVEGRRLTFNLPLSLPGNCTSERVYKCPSDLLLEPRAEYRIAGWLQGPGKKVPLFEFTFHSDAWGRPAPF